MDKKITIAKAMLDIAKSYIQHYFTDLAYDLATLYTSDSDSFIWAIRDTGSDFAVLDSNVKESLCANSILGGYEDRYFLITDSVREITREEMTEIINRA